MPRTHRVGGRLQFYRAITRLQADHVEPDRCAAHAGGLLSAADFPRDFRDCASTTSSCHQASMSCRSQRHHRRSAAQPPITCRSWPICRHHGHQRPCLTTSCCRRNALHDGRPVAVSARGADFAGGFALRSSASRLPLLAAALAATPCRDMPSTTSRRPLRRSRAGDIGLAALFVAASYTCSDLFRLRGAALCRASSALSSCGLGVVHRAVPRTQYRLRRRKFRRDPLSFLCALGPRSGRCGTACRVLRRDRRVGTCARSAGSALIIQPRIAQSLSGLPAGAVMWLGVALLALPCASTSAVCDPCGAPSGSRAGNCPCRSYRLALAQIALGTLNYLFVAGALYAVLRRAPNADYFCDSFSLCDRKRHCDRQPHPRRRRRPGSGGRLFDAGRSGHRRSRDVSHDVLLVPLAFGLVSFAIAEFLAMRRPAKPHN